VGEFLSLFHRFGYIYKPLAGGSWLSANEKWRLTDSEVLKAVACAHPKFFLGCRAGKATRFAVLDIDAGSPYHTKRQLDRLLAVLAGAGLSRSVLYRSSFSGGWHLYIFFDEPVASAELRRYLVELLKLHDFDLAKGSLEVFPHPGKESLGLGLRLPLQPGWAWLDRQTLEVVHDRSDLSPTAALELFIDDLNGDSNTYADFRRLKSYVEQLRSRRDAVTGGGGGPAKVVPIRSTRGAHADDSFGDFVRSVFQEMPPGINPDSWYRGRLYHLSGLQAPSQRADAIFCLSHYLFYGDPSRELPALGYGYEQEREWAIREFLSRRHNGQSKDINRGRPDALSQVERSAHWRPPHRRDGEQIKYSDKRPVAWIRENVNRKADARKRIEGALDSLKQLRRSFTTVELQEKAGCSRRTLYDHADIWRKDYEDLAEGFFAICTDEYNAVVGAACSESTPPSTQPDQIMPPGRLAARRVAYEVKMRAERKEAAKENEVVASRRAAEDQWRDRVEALTSESVSELTVERLKVLLVVLSGYLGTAPCEEDAVSLLRYVQELREELRQHMTGPVDPRAKPPPC